MAFTVAFAMYLKERRALAGSELEQACALTLAIRPMQIKKLEFADSWHLGQFRHADFRTETGILIRVAVLALGALSVGASPRGPFRGCGGTAAPYTHFKVAKNHRKSILM